MVYYKRAVLASCFALASSISAKEGTPSLKEIIHEIPEDNVRVSIETAYMNGNFDEVEKGLFSYLDEYNFDNIAAENVQEVKEKAWSIISERVEEMRTAAYVDSPDELEDAEPSPSEDEEMNGPPPSEYTDGLAPPQDPLDALRRMSIADIVASIPDEAVRMRIQGEMKDGNWILTEVAIDNFVKALPGVTSELFSGVKEIIHEKVEPFLPKPAGEHQLMEGESNIVDALHGIAITQQKIADLINELEGGL
mmetsp:Transcript_5138/g.6446  ORF Transcript_5138/g.6446 Transcript_5138/m.6446 type:complete len:251 (-) Transcript_5138:132-884(-)